MEVRVLSRNNIRDEILNLMRVEIKTKKIHSLPVGFYATVRKILDEYESEKKKALENRDIETYLSTNKDENTLKNDFRWFLQKRWEKLAAYAPYDVDQETLSVLSNPEKAALLEFKAVYSKYLAQFLGGEQ